MNKTIIGVVTESTDHYVPKNTLSSIVLNNKGLPIAVHRLSDGAGTHLFSKRDQSNTKFFEVGL